MVPLCLVSAVSTDMSIGVSCSLTYILDSVDTDLLWDIVSYHISNLRQVVYPSQNTWAFLSTFFMKFEIGYVSLVRACCPSF